jgi:selenocysteine lyase/cysteine desulfurase
VAYAPVVAPDLRIDRDALRGILRAHRSATPRLFAYPAQSNYSGVQHPLELVAEAQERGWDVLLDAAAFIPTNRLDLRAVRPDFVVASFYKIFGYPTGVGCLLARRERLAALQRPWFAGGTVEIASVGLRRHVLHDGPAAFEDGTVDYLNLPAITTGLAHVARVGRDAIHDRVGALTEWLLDELAVLRHRNGTPVVRVLGPATTQERGGTVTFMVHGVDGASIDGHVVESLANACGISLRSGCFCNPGAAEAALGIDPLVVSPWFERGATYAELRDGMRDRGTVVAAVRVSFGTASNFADAYRLTRFLAGFVDRDALEALRVHR